MSAAPFQQPPPIPPAMPAQPGGHPFAAAPLAEPRAPVHSAPPPEPMARAHRAPRRKIARSTIGWGLMASVAVAYLALAAARPELLAQIAAGNGSTAEPQADAVAELRNTVDSLSKDVAELRSRVGEVSLANERITQRMSTLTTASVSASEPPADAASDDAPSAPVLRLDSAPVNGPVAKSGAAAKSKTADAKVLNAAPAAPAKAPAAIETGSVKQAPAEVPPFGAAVVKPAARPVGLQIATGSSLDALRLSWSLLSETHATSLKDLEPRYSTSVDANGLVYNLMAGPVKSEADARKMCKDLASKAIPCKIVGDFSGAAL